MSVDCARKCVGYPAEPRRLPTELPRTLSVQSVLGPSVWPPGDDLEWPFPLRGAGPHRGHVPSRRLRALVREMPELGELTPRRPGSEVRGSRRFREARGPDADRGPRNAHGASANSSSSRRLYLGLSLTPHISWKAKKKTLNVRKWVVPASIRTPMGLSSCLENARVGRNTAAESSFSIGASSAAQDTPYT
ncbi:hypothetical protein E5288_WYG003699 [Bos mutus]|uniref:Uncharacterized protein n=1 Tax=Bos mutus TaxID=72004 RepID=A0A6B0SAP7_9CETA|nr:hypothetical protein [Bos mutus]